MWLLRQKNSNNIVNPHKVVTEVRHTWYYERRFANIFFHWKNSLFFEDLCFQHPFRSLRNFNKTHTLNVKIPSGALWFFSLSKIHNDYKRLFSGVGPTLLYKKKETQFFFNWKNALFWTTFLSTRQVVRIWSYNLHNFLSNYLLDFYELFCVVNHIR